MKTFSLNRLFSLSSLSPLSSAAATCLLLSSDQLPPVLFPPQSLPSDKARLDLLFFFEPRLRKKEDIFSPEGLLPQEQTGSLRLLHSTDCFILTKLFLTLEPSYQKQEFARLELAVVLRSITTGADRSLWGMATTFIGSLLAIPVSHRETGAKQAFMFSNDTTTIHVIGCFCCADKICRLFFAPHKHKHSKINFALLAQNLFYCVCVLKTA